MVFSESLEAAARANSGTLAIDMHVGGAFSSAADVFLEGLISWSTQRFGIQECVNAKEEFYRLTGKVFYDDETYHSRMHYFLEYFLFERTIHTQSIQRIASTPFEAYLEEDEDAMISGFTHSLFRVTKIHSQGMFLKDIFSDHKFRIQKQEEELFKGISKGDIFQGFVFHLQDHSVLSRGLIFHPLRAHRHVLKAVNNEKKRGYWNPNQMLARLARQQLKHVRLKHVDPKLVYSDPNS